ncbi:hypothetical protein [Tropicimonas sediminicola]|uniref:hypothetical protein n=1 Tax=Tropicimonas sediminicola TaxID=1031541 RepID=UPI001595C4B3|nr:hypothetical protein [Tropicimonas sediminicola]
MRPWRLISLLLLVLCLLPWGAYSGAHAAGATALQELMPAPTVDPTPERASPPPHECRIATLPGATCGPDLALVAALTKWPATAGAAPLRPAPGTLRRGLHPPGLLDPPRDV